MKVSAVEIGLVAVTALGLGAWLVPAALSPTRTTIRGSGELRRTVQPTSSADSSTTAANAAIEVDRRTRKAAPGPAPEGMVWVPGGTFWMGADDASMPDAKPVHEVTVSGFWMDRTEVTNRQFARFVKETAYSRSPSARPTPRTFPMRLRRSSFPARSSSRRRPDECRSTTHWSGGATSRSELAASRGTGNRYRRQRRISGRPDLLVRRRRLRQLGRQAAADRGGMGVRGARRQGACALRLGRRPAPRRKMAGQYLGGALPRPEQRRRRFRPHRTGRNVSTQRFRSVRHRRQRLGMVQRLVSSGL